MGRGLRPGLGRRRDRADAALDTIRDARAFVLDLRETPSGGDTSIAEPLMGRFMTQTRPYQRTVYPDGREFIATVTPRGPWTAQGPLMVLVGRWTGSMGEGMAIGLDAMERGTVIGSAMAGLAGSVEGFTLRRTEIPLQFPTYDLTHLDGTPRPDWRPPVAVVSDAGAGEDPARDDARRRLAAALANRSVD